MASAADNKRYHYDLKNVGLRAQATASGLVQLCKELQSAGVLDDPAMCRIKGAIADEIALTAPRSMLQAEYRKDVCRRLDALFAGTEKVGDADALSAYSDES